MGTEDETGAEGEGSSHQSSLGTENTASPRPALVDHFMPPTWGKDLAAALNPWRQGDAFADLALFWAGPEGEDPVTGAPPGEGGDWELVYDPTARAEYGIIRSQTCDIGAGGPGRKHPFVDVSPVYEASDLSNGDRTQICNYAVTYLVALTEPPASGFWVADLRVSLPISKALLVKQTRLEVFNNEEDRLDFGEMLAAKYRRPALDEAVSEGLTAVLREFAAEPGGPAGWADSVEQVRIILKGDRLAPHSVTLLFTTLLPIDATARAHIHTCRTRAARALKRGGIRLDSLQIQTEDKISAAIYRSSVPLRVEGLGRRPTW
jgi:hypothetical protein